MADFLAVFHQIWTSEGPNVVKILSARVSDPFPVTFPGGKFWYHGEKKLAHFWARREARFAICPFFYEKIFFSARLVFRPSRTAKKAAKRTRAGFRTCGSALATLLPPSTTRDFHLGPKPPNGYAAQNCSHPDLRGLVGTLFGSIFDENWSGVAVLKKWPFFFMVEGPIFGHFSPNLDLRRPKCRENSERPRFRPLSGHSSGG